MIILVVNSLFFYHPSALFAILFFVIEEGNDSLQEKPSIPLLPSYYNVEKEVFIK